MAAHPKQIYLTSFATNVQTKKISAHSARSTVLEPLLQWLVQYT